MIRSHDRSGWFGASDTARIMGSWDTRTFRLWWLEKLGLRQNHYISPAMAAGTAYEHRILDAVGVSRRDRQLRRPWLRLRVNLDGETRAEISEVKTYHTAPFRVSEAYWMQCQVEQFAARKRCRIVAYQLTDAEYQNYFLPIDPARISYHPIEYDPVWVREEYLPRLKYLALCLVCRATLQWEEFLTLKPRIASARCWPLALTLAACRRKRNMLSR